MELPVKFDLSNLSGVGLAQVLFPFLPGGILVLGAGVIYPEIAARFFAVPYLGYFAKVGMGVFAAYVCGLFLAFSVVGVVGGTAGSIAAMLGGTFRWKWKPWQNSIWRQTAKRFIGEKVTPIIDLPLDPETIKMQLETAKMRAAASGGSPDLGYSETLSIHLQQSEKMIADIHWSEWFSALEAYFSFPERQADHVGTIMSQATHSSAWAVMILMYFGPYHSWVAWLVCGMVVIGAFIGYLFDFLNPAMATLNASRKVGAMLRILIRPATDGTDANK